jgi:hypothetical protein
MERLQDLSTVDVGSSVECPSGSWDCAMVRVDASFTTGVLFVPLSNAGARVVITSWSRMGRRLRYYRARPDAVARKKETTTDDANAKRQTRES